MANTKSAQKALRVSERKTALNKKIKTTYKDAKKKVADLVNGGKAADAKKELSKAYKAIDKAVKNNVLHKNKGGRLKSEISKLLGKDTEKKAVAKKTTTKKVTSSKKSK